MIYLKPYCAAAFHPFPPLSFFSLPRFHLSCKLFTLCERCVGAFLLLDSCVCFFLEHSLIQRNNFSHVIHNEGKEDTKVNDQCRDIQTKSY